MFIDTPNAEELRQGDIVYGIYFPQMLCSSMLLLGQSRPVDPLAAEHPALTPVSAQKGKPATLTAQIEVMLIYAMVVSHCCDLEVREGKKRPDLLYIAMSPLLDIPYLIRTDNDRLQQLRDNSNPLINAGRSFINLFHIPQHPPLPSEKMIDYNIIISVPAKDYEYVLGNKVLQMTDEHRIRLKNKMSFNYGRYTQEERDAGFVPPSLA